MEIPRTPVEAKDLTTLLPGGGLVRKRWLKPGKTLARPWLLRTTELPTTDSCNTTAEEEEEEEEEAREEDEEENAGAILLLLRERCCNKRFAR